MENKVIDIANLAVSLSGHNIVSDVSFSVLRGEVVALIGPNGAGKTTLIKAVIGALPYSGKISVFNKDGEKGKIGYVPQRFSFDRGFPLSVSEFLSLNLDERSFNKSYEALKDMGGERLISKRLGDLSGGELQRVLLARSLARDPDLWLLDEASSGIDMDGVENFYSLVRRVAEERGMAAIFVSHDIGMVSRFASRVICLNGGLVCDGIPSDALTEESLNHLYGDESSKSGHTHGN